MSSLSLFTTACADEPGQTVGDPERVSAAEFETAISDAASGVLAARAIYATEVQRFSSGREEWRWFDHRSEGEYALVEHVEFVAEGGESGSSRTTATIVRGTTEYTAQHRSGRDPTAWTAIDLREGLHHQLGHPLRRALPIVSPEPESGRISFDSGFLEAFDHASLEVTHIRQGTDDGGYVWRLSVRPRDDTGYISMAFGIHPDGHLRSYAFEVSPQEEETTSTSMPEPSRMVHSELRLEPMEGMEPIQPPQVGTPLDLSRFDLPDGFPSTS